MQQDDITIEVKNIYKDFSIATGQANSIKSLFTAMGKNKSQTKTVQNALKDISFSIKKGEFFGVLGRNGSGKSTLLKILSGIYQPTSGSLRTEGKLVPFIELGVGFNPELTGRENVYLNGAMLGFSEKEISAMYDEIVAFAELENYMDKKLKNYSSGMQVRLAFSMATRAEADILIVDEVLAVGDADFQKKCYKYFKDLKRAKKTVVFVSHDMNAIEEYCDRAILIENSEIIVEGTSHEVAMAYTRMFLENDTKALKVKKRRWGDKKITYSSVALEPNLLGDEKHLKIIAKADVNSDLDEAVLGFKIRTEEDAQLVGSNTRIKRQKLVDLAKGDKITVEWTVPNVLNTSNYFIDVAAQSHDYAEVHDWWEGAANLQVERSEENSYPVHPIISLSINKSSK